MDGLPRAIDPVEHAHLRDATGFSPPVHRYAPGPGLADLVRRYWVPVWSLPPGTVSRQRVLQYPVCLVVVADSYARVYGVRTGLSVVELSGTGWAVGAMLQPAAGALVWGAPVTELTDRFVDLPEAPGVDGIGLTARIREAMGPDPDAAGRLAAVAHLERELGRLPPVDDEGRLVNAIVEYVEGDPEVRRVSQVCAKFDIGDRTLQRLLARRLGLAPKWLIQRRRLQEAAARLRTRPGTLARVAAELGYADQAHFTRDFRTVTGLTPGDYAAEPRPS